MIQIFYTDGQTLTVEGTSTWRVDGPVVKIGAFVGVMANIRGWRIAEPEPNAVVPVEPTPDISDVLEAD